MSKIKSSYSDFLVFSAYDFLPFTEKGLKRAQEEVYRLAEKHQILGLFILSREGYNMSFSGKIKNVRVFKGELKRTLQRENIFYKESFAKTSPFLDLKVKIRKEIVSLNRSDLKPEKNTLGFEGSDLIGEDHLNSVCSYKCLSPKEWHKKLKNSSNEAVILDVRNEYEIKLGKFKKALSSPISEFNEFPYSLEKYGREKDKEFLVYCTGGVRCEKAALVMKESGFKRVSQLEGGILNYLLHYPYEEFEGECFVFDQRVAVDQNLKPTKIYHICPHCGDPGKTLVSCLQCQRNDFICENCFIKGSSYQTCSKNCAHHFKMNHKTTRVHKESFVKRI